MGYDPTIDETKVFFLQPGTITNKDNNSGVPMNDKRGELFAGKLASTVWGEEYPPALFYSGGGVDPTL